MGIRKIDFETCNSCGICVSVCPMDVLRIDEQSKEPVVQYLGDCISCFLCEDECPKDAIYVSTDRERRIPLSFKM